jgi:hypothetical protein
MLTEKINRRKVVKQLALLSAFLLPSFKIILAQDKNLAENKNLEFKTGYGQGGYGAGLYNNIEEKNTI